MSGPFRKESDPALEPEHDDFRSWLSDRLCPACNTAMYAAERKRMRLDACGSCGGVWLTGDDAKYLLASKDASFGVVAEAAARGSEMRDPRRDKRICPDCKYPLREGYLKTGDINVDICAADGTWFDAHELNAMVAHLQRQHVIDESQRPIEMETTFMQIVRKTFDAIRAKL